jgi:predicted amidohydrolase YtcJ
VGPRYLVVGAVVAAAALAVALVLTATSEDDPPSARVGEPTLVLPTPTPTVAFACRPLTSPTATPVTPGGDLALANAQVVTMVGRQRADSVTIAAGRITDVGGASEEAVDLQGAAVLPGLIDSHSHWIGDKDLAGNNAIEAIEAALSQGWTSITEMFVDDRRLNELCSLARNGDLRLKVGAFLPINYEFQRFGHVYEAFEPGQALGSRLFVQGVKAFADRAEDGLGYQSEPPDPAVQGTLFWEGDELSTELQAAHDAGWQLAVHATGDAGLDAVLAAFETLGRDEIVASRHRIEHLSMVRDGQIQRIADLGLIASVQHSWYSADAVDNLTRWLGQDRTRLSGRWRDLLEAGVPLTGGTDHPWAIVGKSGRSIEAIAQAVTRVGSDGAQPPPWMKEQRLTVWEVLRSLTTAAAFARGTDDSVGSLEVGKAGDLVVLSADPTRVPSLEIADIEVLATVVDGQVEYCGARVPPDLAPLCPS